MRRHGAANTWGVAGRLRRPRLSDVRGLVPAASAEAGRFAVEALRSRLPAPLARRLGIALRRGLTLANITDRLAETYGDRVAFSLAEPSRLCGRREISFTGAHRAVSRLATALAASGIGAGDLVVVVPSNGCDFVLAFLAVVRAGGIAVPVNPVLKPPEVRTLVALSGACTALVDPETILRTAGGRRNLPGVERWLSLGAARGATDVLAASRRVRTAAPAVPVAPDTVVAVMYTSGTTGRPKGARLTNEGLLSLLSAAALHPTGLPGAVRLAVSALPVAHIMGLGVALGLLLAGIPHRMLARFDAGQVLDIIERDRADLFVGVPAMYRAMLDAGAAERDLTSVKAWASAADVMPAGLARRFQSFGRLAGPVPAIFVEAYGMVELAGAAMVRVVPPLPGPLARIAAALPVPPYKVRVVDETGRAVPRGRVGELCVSGPGVLEGYHGDAEATGKVLRGGWLRTGDLARIGPFGTVIFEGRSKDVIKVGGYSVYPVEVEEEIRRHAKVSDVAVLGVVDALKGEVPAAAVVPARGARLDVGELERWARESIASYRRPRRWMILERLPRGSTRKVDKAALRQRFEQEDARGRRAR